MREPKGSGHGLNSNVLIELGFAYGRDTQTVLLINSSEHLRLLGITNENIPLPIPEDLAGKQRLEYRDLESLKLAVRHSIQSVTNSRLSWGSRFRLAVFEFLEAGEKPTTAIAEHVQRVVANDISYQTTRNWLETLVSERVLDRENKGNKVFYCRV